MLGYFTRGLLLVVSITVVLLLAFIVPSMLSLRGTALQALMQFVTYIGLPSLAYGFYVLICRASHLPLVAAIRERR